MKEHEICCAALAFAMVGVVCGTNMPWSCDSCSLDRMRWNKWNAEEGRWNSDEIEAMAFLSASERCLLETEPSVPDEGEHRRKTRHLMRLMGIPCMGREVACENWQPPVEMEVDGVAYRVSYGLIHEDGACPAHDYEVFRAEDEMLVAHGQWLKFADAEEARVFGFASLFTSREDSVLDVALRNSAILSESSSNAIYVARHERGTRSEGRRFRKPDAFIYKNVLLTIDAESNGTSFAVAFVNAGLPKAERISSRFSMVGTPPPIPRKDLSHIRRRASTMPGLGPCARKGGSFKLVGHDANRRVALDGGTKDVIGETMRGTGTSATNSIPSGAQKPDCRGDVILDPVKWKPMSWY